MSGYKCRLRFIFPIAPPSCPTRCDLVVRRWGDLSTLSAPESSLGRSSRLEYRLGAKQSSVHGSVRPTCRQVERARSGTSLWGGQSLAHRQRSTAKQVRRARLQIRRCGKSPNRPRRPSPEQSSQTDPALSHRSRSRRDGHVCERPLVPLSACLHECPFLSMCLEVLAIRRVHAGMLALVLGSATSFVQQLGMHGHTVDDMRGEGPGFWQSAGCASG